MNTETGDYRLPDGIRGNLITNPGPLENYDPESGAYDSDDTDRSTDRSTDSAATEAGSRVAGSSSSSAGGGTTNRNNGGGLEILTNDAMPMAIKQSGWALVGFVGVMMVIEWM